MEKQKQLILISEYSKSPGPRYCYQGDDSGEDFYHSQLNEKFKISIDLECKLIVNLDGPDGYASSFLDEAFGNLVYDFGLERVSKHVEFISLEEPEWIDMLVNETYVQWESRRVNNQPPKKTTEHEGWWRFNYQTNQSEKGKWIVKD